MGATSSSRNNSYPPPPLLPQDVALEFGGPNRIPFGSGQSRCLGRTGGGVTSAPNLAYVAPWKCKPILSLFPFRRAIAVGMPDFIDQCVPLREFSYIGVDKINGPFGCLLWRFWRPFGAPFGGLGPLLGGLGPLLGAWGPFWGLGVGIANEGKHGGRRPFAF